MKCMENKVAFLTSVIMMIFNNATFIIQWLTIFAIRETLGGYTLNEIVHLCVKKMYDRQFENNKDNLKSE